MKTYWKPTETFYVVAMVWVYGGLLAVGLLWPASFGTTTPLAGIIGWSVWVAPILFAGVVGFTMFARWLIRSGHWRLAHRVTEPVKTDLREVSR